MKKMAGSFRSVEDVSKSLELAKLNESELENVSQAIWLSPDLGIENMKILEIDNKLLNYLNTGKSLTIRGLPSDFAVLCTEDETYEIKEAETSNSMLLIPNLNLPTKEISTERQIHKAEVVEIHRTYFELRPCNSRLKKLKESLFENPYRGREYEINNDNRKFTMNYLLDNVQCSEKQLKKALFDMKACEIDGFWRVLDVDYEFRVVTYITNLVYENSWSFNEISLETVLDVLEELEPREILKHCLQMYANEITDGIYSLKEKEICRLHGEILLISPKMFNLNEFLLSWQGSVPEGFVTDIEYLKGIVLIDYKCFPNVIEYFTKNDLPDDIVERFKVLFKKKEKWSLDEIEPFINDLTTEKVNANALLMKYTRSSQINGIRYFNSK